MKKILIALDYDQNSQKVAEKGFDIARSMGAEVILLHVISDEKYYAMMESSPIMGYVGFNNIDFFQLVNTEGLPKAANYYLEKLKHHLGDDKIETIVGTGECADVILKTASHKHVDIIVMGSHSRRWLDQILLGSVTEKVLRQTTVSLLIIPIKKQNP